MSNSRFEKEPLFEKRTVPFAPELCSLIKERRKWKTYRFGSKYDYLNVGDKVLIQNVKTKEILGKATITSKERTAFKEIPLDIEGHESYESKKEQRNVFSDYYAYIGREVKDDDPFIVLEFELE